MPSREKQSSIPRELFFPYNVASRVGERVELSPASESTRISEYYIVEPGSVSIHSAESPFL